MIKQTQSRWKSPVFWSALAAQVLTVLVYCGVLDVAVSDGLRNWFCAALELLVAFGILNDPTNGAGI